MTETCSKYFKYFCFCSGFEMFSVLLVLARTKSWSLRSIWTLRFIQIYHLSVSQSSCTMGGVCTSQLEWLACTDQSVCICRLSCISIISVASWGILMEQWDPFSYFPNVFSDCGKCSDPMCGYPRNPFKVTLASKRSAFSQCLQKERNIRNIRNRKTNGFAVQTNKPGLGFALRNIWACSSDPYRFKNI